MLFLISLYTCHSFPETCSTHEEDKCTKITVKKSQGKQTLGRHAGRWENNIGKGKVIPLQALCGPEGG